MANCELTLGCHSDTPGAEVIQSMLFLENSGQLQRGDYTNSMISNIVSYGFFSAAQSCSDAFNTTQAINVDCQGSFDTLGNPNCQLCIDTVNKIVKDRLQLDRVAHNKNSKYAVPVIDSKLQNQLFGDPNVSVPGSAGICRYMCLQCVAENIEQNMNVRIQSTCDFSDSIFREFFRKGVTTASISEMYKHKNELDKTGLATKSADDVKQLGIHLSNTIINMTGEHVMAGLKQDIFALQNITFDPQSTSVVVTNFEQNMTISSTAKMLENTFTKSNINDSTKSSETEEIIKLRTTLEDLSKDLEATVDSFLDLAKSIIGRFIMTVVILLLVALLVFAAVFYFKPDFLFYGAKSFGGDLSSIS